MNPLTDHPAELMQLWREVNHEIHERVRFIFQELKLPPVAPVLLKQVCRQPGVTVSELSRRTGIAKSHVSRMLDMMAASGYVTKESDPQDQRLVRVFPTEQAMQRLHEVTNRLAESWAKATADLTPQEVESVVRGFRVLLTALRRAKK